MSQLEKILPKLLKKELFEILIDLKDTTHQKSDTKAKLIAVLQEYSNEDIANSLQEATIRKSTTEELAQLKTQKEVNNGKRI